MTGETACPTMDEEQLMGLAAGLSEFLPQAA
jgi:hypothetical protein